VKDCAYARKEFFERERLDQIVVCTELEPCEAVADGVAGRQKDHRQVAAAAQATDELEPVAVREHYVDDREIGCDAEDRTWIRCVGEAPDCESFASQCLFDRRPHALVVLDDDDAQLRLAHRRSIRS
jgi:hypothetical protein